MGMLHPYGCAKNTGDNTVNNNDNNDSDYDNDNDTSCWE